MQMPETNYFERMLRGEAEAPAILTTLGGVIRAVDVAAGTLETDYLGTSAFLNPAGQIQGGMLCSMLDDVTAFLVTATLRNGEHCATLNLNVYFLRPAQVGPLHARAQLVRRGRSVCHVHGELFQNGKQVATAVATCTVARQH